jgi:hypothetical protein
MGTASIHRGKSMIRIAIEISAPCGVLRYLGQLRDGLLGYSAE